MKKILIIEDEPAMRANLVDLLEMENYHALAAANGVEGVTRARSELPDLILCDVMMPKLDGHGVLAALQDDSRTSRIPFVFLTAKGERADVRAGMELGADDYLVKPVPRKELLGAVKARLERAERQRIEFRVEYKSAKPLESLGLTPREAEVLFWTAQGKTNAEIGVILGVLPSTAKSHLENIYEKLQVDGRHNATLRALEVLAANAA
jgi:DNA-binding NarL/FixJ family response regulator